MTRDVFGGSRSARPSSVCLGIFDGVHRGHRRILRAAVAAARKARTEAIGVTFDPHPSAVLTPARRTPLLYSLRHRLLRMKLEGLDRCIVVPFTKRLARVSAERFVAEFLAGRLKARDVAVGADFRFGRGAEGGAEALARWSRAYGFRLHALDPVEVDGRPVSSTRIRALVLSGDLAAASRLLGRPVSLFGKVVRGAGRGRTIGFPTVNLELEHEPLPPPGVYAIRAESLSRAWPGALHLGPRPTFGSAECSAEAHLVDASGNFYGREMEFFLLKQIRPIMKFGSINELRDQIRKDLRSVPRSV